MAKVEGCLNFREDGVRCRGVKNRWCKYMKVVNDHGVRWPVEGFYGVVNRVVCELSGESFDTRDMLRRMTERAAETIRSSPTMGGLRERDGRDDL